jgi:hypothetical protein
MSEDLLGEIDGLLAELGAETAHLAHVESAEYTRDEFAEQLATVGWRVVNFPAGEAGRFTAARESNGAMQSARDPDQLLAKIAGYERDQAARGASDSGRPVVSAGLISTETLRPKPKQ